LPVKTRANLSFLDGVSRAPTGRTVVLLSGGADSAAVAAMLKQGGAELWPLFIDYGQVALDAELAAARNLTNALGLRPLRVLPCNLFEQISSLAPHPAQDDNAAWLPARNTLFMLLAGIYAYSIDADGIAFGYVLDDNFVFGDNDYFHHRLVELLLERSFLRPFAVRLPAKACSKREVLAYLRQQGLLDLTVSCWNASLRDGAVLACGSCANCLERAEALQAGASA
jgi:7-cyano-7-deazaguanine synthase